MELLKRIIDYTVGGDIYDFMAGAFLMFLILNTVVRITEIIVVSVITLVQTILERKRDDKKNDS